jgi:hypothetical protein
MRLRSMRSVPLVYAGAMRSFVHAVVALVLVACSSSTPAPAADAGLEAAASGDAAREGSAAIDAGRDAPAQGRDGAAPGEPCTVKEDCREFPCMCSGQRVFRAGCLPAGQCMSQAEICGGLGCQPTN